jgi:hypothetical protein
MINFNRALYYDFALSVDVAVTSSSAAIEKTTCGVFFDADAEKFSGDTIDTLIDADMLVFTISRGQRFRLEQRIGYDWAAGAPLAAGRSTAIQSAQAAPNRVTVVVNGGRAAIFVNGQRVIERAVSASVMDGGALGFYMVRGVAGDEERCDFSNIALWRIN